MSAKVELIVKQNNFSGVKIIQNLAKLIKAHIAQSEGVRRKEKPLWVAGSGF